MREHYGGLGVVPQMGTARALTTTGPVLCVTAPDPQVNSVQLTSRTAHAFHFAHDMFQPLSPLSGATVSSLECLTTTTSPIIEWL